MKHIFKIVFLVSMVLTVNSNMLKSQTANDEVLVRGTITSKSTGEALFGVNVIEIDPDNRNVSGAVTDINGQYVYKMRNPQDNTIRYTFIGYKDQTRKITQSGIVNIELEDETQELDIVTVQAEKLINDGTFSIAQREISTATQTISTEEFEGVQVTSIDEALQGRIAGLDIVANSGDLGSGTTMRIRGASSINANDQPLIVINGIPRESDIDPNFDFASSNQEQYANMLGINPDDIQEITVLKDAASTAIWGIKGANGVIMIKTKRGVSGPTRFQYTYRLSRAIQPKGLNMLNGDDYTMMMKQAYFNPEQNEDAANVRELNYDTSFSEFENYNNNTDWVDEVTQVGWTNDHYLTVSGGGDRANYRVAGGFLNQTGTVIGQKLNRLSSRAYLDYRVSNRLKFTTELSFSYTDNHRNPLAYDTYHPDDDKKRIGPLAIAYRKMPNVSVYDQRKDGSNTDVYYNIARDSELGYHQQYLPNPVALSLLGKNNLKNYRINPTFRLMYDIINPERHLLRYNMYVSFDLDNNNISIYYPLEALPYYYTDNRANRAEGADTENFTFQTDNNITFTPKFTNTNHALTLYASFQARTNQYISQGITSYGLPGEYITDPSATGYLSRYGTTRPSGRSMAVLGRFHYVYKGRYILSGSMRRDGSTRFGENRKFADFPGISAKWIISDEPFMASTKSWLSMLAIRPSYGVSGRQPDEEYLHYSRYGNYGEYIDMTAVSPVSIRLNDLQWEKTTSFNYGADIGFFNDKIVLDLNYYYARTSDLLFKDIPLPSSSGQSDLAWVNGGIVDNEGWEFNIYGNRVVKAGDFSMDFNFNIANNINTIVELTDRQLNAINDIEYSYTNGSYLTRIQENNPFGSIYGFRYKGVYQYDQYIPGIQENAPVARDVNGQVIMDSQGKPLPMVFGYGVESIEEGEGYEFRGGDAIYEDINHDGNIDELDIVYLGNSNPKFSGGFGTTLRYRNFSCTMFFNYRYGTDIINFAKMGAENMYTENNQSIAVNYRWRKDGDVTEMPRALYDYGYNWLGSDRYVEDGSFLRFKYLTFRYDVPKKTLQKYKLNQLNFYLTINNLYVFTKYTGVDPEVAPSGDERIAQDRAQTPRTKDFTFGVTLGF